MTEKIYDVFLSHNNADKPAVEELARRLVKEGIQPWLDTWNLIPGEPWQEAIEEALGHCATCAVFIGPIGAGPWQNEEMRAAIDRRVSHSQDRFRVIPVLLPGAERGERSRLPSFLVTTTWVEFRHTLDDDIAFHRLVCGIRGIEPGPGPGQAIYEGECPYRGLQVFDVQHAPFFFGREALTEWLLNELRPARTTSAQENRFLAIIGPSGSGKSSLARAGLVAALKRGQIEGSADWPIAICRPGPDPLESLAVALADATDLGHSPSALRDLIKDLREDERMLHLTTRLALRQAPSEQRFVLLVDQFEEMFTLCHKDELRQPFLNNLLYAASVTGGQTIILLALRADFYGKCAAYPALATALSDHQVLVGLMTEGELRRAIERPAHLVGCEFEVGLVEQLLRDVEGQPGGLPLLEHALLELWEQRKGRKLSYMAYRAIGGIKGALERRAETVYGQFNEQEKHICRRIFLRLTQPGEGVEDTKRQVSLQELIPAAGEAEMIEMVIGVLADARLVTTEGSKDLSEARFVEVAHEALIRNWSRLRKWIEENREALRIHRRLTEAAKEWQNHSRDSSYLYRGSRLLQSVEWRNAHAEELNELEQSFLEASLFEQDREEKEREKQQRELEEAFQQLKTLDHMKSEFINIATHELRTPLAILMGYASMLEEDLQGTQKDYISTIMRNSLRLTALIDDMLSLQSLESGVVSLSKDPLNLPEAVQAAIDDLSLWAKEKNLTIEVDIPADFPPMIADRQKFDLILINLLNNAVKFTPIGGQISLKARFSEKQALLSINNAHPIIPKEKLDRIFDRFYQIEEQLTREYGGIGLGLSIVKGMIEVCGGEIQVESEEGKGTTFIVTLPLDNSQLKERFLKL